MLELALLPIAGILFLIYGAIAGISAGRRSARLEQQMQILRREVSELRSRLAHDEKKGAGNEVVPATPGKEGGSSLQPQPAAASQTVASSSQPARPSWKRADAPESPAPARQARREPARTGPSLPERWTSSLKQNWMVWLGGICVALAGIFLAQYAIEKGLLGPMARLALGLVTGFALHGGAEYLRGREKSSHPVFAALAGGGSITLFATLLAALHLYEVVSPGITFFLLAVVALLTMALALKHGPLMAALGILGAYAAPVLVSTGSGNVLIALAYSIVITACALLLLRWVWRAWLWWGTVAGALFWWLVSAGHPDAGIFGFLYLATVAWLLIALPWSDWTLSRERRFSAPGYSLAVFRQENEPQEKHLPWSLLAVCLATCFNILVVGNADFLLIRLLPLPALLLLAARRRDSLFALPWLLLAGQCVALMLPVLDETGGRFRLVAGDNPAFLWYALTAAVLYSLLSLRNFAGGHYRAVWASLASLAPVLLLATAYIVTGASLDEWVWAAFAALIACGGLGLAASEHHRGSLDTLVVWLLVAGHFSATLAAVFLLDGAGITLALAAQIVSLTWIISRYQLPALGWLLKGVIVVVIARLTLNPWLFLYPTDNHWTLWTYGGATVFALIGTRLLQNHVALKRWTEGACMHFLVLTVWTELRYWLHEGAVFSADYTFTEASLYVVFFGLLAVVYHQRGLRTDFLRGLYTLFARVLLAFSLLNYCLILLVTLTSGSWQWRDIGDTPVFNLMLLAYGAPVLVGLLVFRFHETAVRKGAIVFTSLAAFVFVSLEIRHLWQGQLRLAAPTSDGELYTYSIVWLLIAIGAMLAGAWRYGKWCSKAGTALLALVIAKIFLVDMSDLEGLLRVASFMGLGLGMLAVSYLYQKLQANDREPAG